MRRCYNNILNNILPFIFYSFSTYDDGDRENMFYIDEYHQRVTAGNAV